MFRAIKERPWIWIIVAFVILICSWVFLLRIAKEHRPEKVEMITITPHERTES